MYCHGDVLVSQIKELEDFFSSQGRPCHIIWTSSGSAKKAQLNVDNIQAEKGWASISTDDDMMLCEMT